MLIFINNYYLRRRHIDAVVTYVLRSSAHAIGQQNNGKQILSGVFFFFFPYTECIFLEEWKRVGVATLDDRTIYAPRCLYKEQQTEKTLLHVQ